MQRTLRGRICLKESYLNVLADKHPLPKLISEYRHVQNVLDRYIDRFEQVYKLKIFCFVAVCLSYIVH